MQEKIRFSPYRRPGENREGDRMGGERREMKDKTLFKGKADRPKTKTMYV